MPRKERGGQTEGPLSEMGRGGRLRRGGPGPKAVRLALPAFPCAAPGTERRAGRDVGPEPTSAPPDTQPGDRAGAPDQQQSVLASPGRGVGRKELCCVTPSLFLHGVGNPLLDSKLQHVL